MGLVARQSARAAVGCLSVAAFILSAASLLGQPVGKRETSADKVKVTAKASRPDATGQQVVTVTLDIARGWHIYANPVKNADYESCRTTIAVAGQTKPRSVKAEYPAGKVRQDKLVGPHMVYEDSVTIRALVQRAQGDTGPLNLAVHVNACDKHKCLAPADIKLTVP